LTEFSEILRQLPIQTASARSWNILKISLCDVFDYDLHYPSLSKIIFVNSSQRLFNAYLIPATAISPAYQSST